MSLTLARSCRSKIEKPVVIEHLRHVCVRTGRFLLHIHVAHLGESSEREMGHEVHIRAATDLHAWQYTRRRVARKPGAA